MKTIKLFAALFTALVACAAAPVQAQPFPNQPVKMIVGFSAGSISDRIARSLAEQLKDVLGQQVLIENLPGAGSTLAAARAARAPADGYTIYFAAMGHALAPAVYSKLPYDTLADFAGVALVSNVRVLLVTHPKMKARNLSEFLADAKANPGKYSYGSSGNGTFLHLIAESLAQATGTKFLHVPYRAGVDAMNGVISESVDLAFCTVSTCIEHVRTGRLKTYGYIGKERSPSAPEVPTFGEAGLKDFDVASYNYILAPAATPRPILDQLHKAINQVVMMPKFHEQLRRLGVEPTPSDSAASVTEFVKAEVDRWTPLVKAIGLRAD